MSPLPKLMHRYHPGINTLALPMLTYHDVSHRPIRCQWSQFGASVFVLSMMTIHFHSLRVYSNSFLFFSSCCLLVIMLLIFLITMISCRLHFKISKFKNFQVINKIFLFSSQVSGKKCVFLFALSFYVKIATMMLSARPSVT